jgi:hypothetical protein
MVSIGGLLEFVADGFRFGEDGGDLILIEGGDGTEQANGFFAAIQSC